MQLQLELKLSLGLKMIVVSRSKRSIGVGEHRWKLTNEWRVEKRVIDGGSNST